MITKPSMSQLILAVRARLADAVLPALDQEQLVVEVHMMLSILDTLAVRCNHEIAWMRQETTAIEQMARRLDGPVAVSIPLATALEALDGADATSDHLPDVSARYDLAGEVLSCLAEVDDPALAEPVGKLIHARLDHERAIVGAFSAVGRGQ